MYMQYSVTGKQPKSKSDKNNKKINDDKESWDKILLHIQI